MSRLHRRVDIAWLIAFRVAFGAILTVQAARIFASRGFLENFVEPDFHFTYLFFSWVEPLPGLWLYAVVALVGVCAVGIAAGFLYRLSATGFTLGFSYLFLIEQSRYLNHYYLVILLGFLLVVLPAHRAWSLDARLFPRVHSQTVPAWTLWLVRAQIAIVYAYAGIAKLNADWLRGEPIRSWMEGRADLPLVGPFLGEDWCVLLITYGGLLLDLLAAPLLFWRRTRTAALVVVTLFHLANWYLFDIGIFPWLMISATLVFFEPSWPRDLARRLGLPRGGAERPAAAASGDSPSTSGPLARLQTGFVIVWIIAQLLVPLRHHLYPGDVAWSEEGHRFSWRMKLRDKEGWSSFEIREPGSGRIWSVDPRDDLTERQASKMSGNPDMVLQFAHYLASKFSRPGEPPVEVRARVLASLNARPYRLLVDPDANLAAVKRSFRPATWILPLEAPLTSPDTRLEVPSRRAVPGAEQRTVGPGEER